MIYFNAAYVAKCYLEEHGFEEVYTNDHHMLKAAPHFHLTGVNVLSESG